MNLQKLGLQAVVQGKATKCTYNMCTFSLYVYIGRG